MRSLMPHSSSPSDTTTEVPWLLVGLITMHVLYGLFLIWRCGPSWAVAMLWAGACAVVGGTVGFLFGIPRTSQDGGPVRRDVTVQTTTVQDASGLKQSNTEAHATGVQPASSNAPTAGYDLKVNTNLEQISDWLTKILVGVGLTQIHELPSVLSRAANFIASGLTGGVQVQRNVALALLIYFPVLGFLSGYLCTRLFLQPAFRRFDQNQDRSS